MRLPTESDMYISFFLALSLGLRIVAIPMDLAYDTILTRTLATAYLATSTQVDSSSASISTPAPTTRMTRVGLSVSARPSSSSFFSNTMDPTTTPPVQTAPTTSSYPLTTSTAAKTPTPHCPNGIRVRKEYRSMSPMEWVRFKNALEALMLTLRVGNDTLLGESLGMYHQMVKLIKRMGT